MALIFKKKLILVEAKEIEFPDKQNPSEIVKKFKYTFLDETGNLVEGYLDTPDYVKDVQDVEGFDESKAKVYSFAVRKFNDKTSYILQPKAK